MMRAATSGGPPGPNGTMSLIGWSGNVAALPFVGTPNATAPASAIAPSAQRIDFLPSNIPSASFYCRIVTLALPIASILRIDA
jgi:hypothetical protein